MQKAIVQNGKVINVLTYSDDIGIQGIRLRRDQMLIDASGYAVQIGDAFDGAQFLRNGEPVPAIDPDAPTAEEMSEALGILGVEV